MHGKIIPFPSSKIITNEDPLAYLKKSIQKRFGVTLQEYCLVKGKRSPEVQAKIDRALKKEMLKYLSQSVNTDEKT